jgi:hypothetical protein
MKEDRNGLVWVQKQWHTRNAAYTILQLAGERYCLFGAVVPGPEAYLGNHATLEEAQAAAEAHRHDLQNGRIPGSQEATPKGLRRMTEEEMRDAVWFAFKDADEQELRHWCKSIFLTGDLDPIDEDEENSDEGG